MSPTVPDPFQNTGLFCPVPADVEIGVHVRHLGLDELELPNGCPKLLALMGIVKCCVTTGLHDACIKQIFYIAFGIWSTVLYTRYRYPITSLVIK